MKIYASLLALCVLQKSSTAFVVQAPKSNALQHGLWQSSNSNLDGMRANLGNGAGDQSPNGPSAPLAKPAAKVKQGNDIWDTTAPVKVQGGSLRTWSFPNHRMNYAQVLLKTDGRPLNADVELWQGPDNKPQKMAVYVEDGALRPFSAIVATPRDSNAVAVYNTSPLEYPLDGCVVADDGSASLTALAENLAAVGPRVVQGGAVFTTPFDASVESVQMLIETEGRPLNCRIELLQGPNNIKQAIDLYTEDGRDRPFICVMDTPGSGNVVRIVNTATMEYPLAATVEPYTVDASY